MLKNSQTITVFAIYQCMIVQIGTERLENVKADFLKFFWTKTLSVFTQTVLGIGLHF